MTRVLRFLFRNWPLKLAAIASATLLYAGVVLSESILEFPGQVPIDIRNPPQNAAVLTAIEPVELIRFRAPLDVASRLTEGSFAAWVDLRGVEPSEEGELVERAVEVIAVDPSVQVVDFQPRTVQVLVEPVTSRPIGITVDDGAVPPGLTVGPAQVEPAQVDVRGARTRVDSVQSVVARVTIDASGIDVDQEVDLEPLDEAGNVVPGVELTPERARVQIAVAQQLASATIPVRPELVGEVASGYAIEAITFDPLSVTVSGDEAAVEQLTTIPTEPIDVSGRTGTMSVSVPLVAPEQVTINGASNANVTIRIGPAEGARTMQVGVQLDGERPDLAYTLPVESVMVTLTGPIPILDALDVADLAAVLDVAGLGAGEPSVIVQVAPPDGTRVASVAPEAVTISIVERPQPSPTSDGVALPSPSGGP